MNKRALLLATISFLILGIIESILFYLLYDNYLPIAIVQWPVLTGIYSAFLIHLLQRTSLNRRSLHFTGYFTVVTLLLTGCCLSFGYASILIAVPLSGICAFCFLHGIQVYLSSNYTFPAFGIFLVGSFACLVNLLLWIPAISDLLHPIFYNKGFVIKLVTPYFLLWTFFVGSFSIFCLYFKKENPYHVQ